MILKTFIGSGSSRLDMIGPSWKRGVFLSEIRRMLAYRANFWLGFAGYFVIQLAVTWFLWSSLFETTGKEKIGGYSLFGMVLYSIMAAGTQRMLYADSMGTTAMDIYTGALSKYIVYPVSYFSYRLSVFLAQTVYFSQQLVASVFLFLLLFPFPGDLKISFWSVTGGILMTFAGAVAFFWLSLIIELVAFWFENVWALIASLRIIAAMLGGVVIPLSLFPDSVQRILKLMPFSVFVSYPVRTLMGEVSLPEFLKAFSLCAVWAAIFYFFARLVFHRGSRLYTGVGI